MLVFAAVCCKAACWTGLAPPSSYLIWPDLVCKDRNIRTLVGVDHIHLCLAVVGAQSQCAEQSVPRRCFGAARSARARRVCQLRRAMYKNRRARAACRYRHGESWPCVGVKDQGSAMAAIEHRPRGHYSTVQLSSDRYRDQNKRDLVMTATLLLASMIRSRVHICVQTTLHCVWVGVQNWTRGVLSVA